ncbi:MAG: hypothetical protein HRT58_19400 [Crocinitomicaceae bacterium]|nr:hypothetical protein [Flavobacteriales bacterium]NQZ37836.1 hypothetical protein [Crocinitomicaceae bacterium]
MSETKTLEKNGIGTDTAVYAPLMDEVYTSKTRTFRKVEDISGVKRTSGATDNTWLVFTNTVTWPGPKYHLVGGPLEIPARDGIRGIPLDKIKVDIVEAFKLASDVLHRINCGDEFVGTINMYWPLTAPGLNPEPYYMFTINCLTVITVGAFTGNVHFN